MRAPGAAETCLAGPSTETRCRGCRIQTCACWRLAARMDAVGAARPDLVGLLGTARDCAPAAPFSFVGSTSARLGPVFRGSLVGLSAGALVQASALLAFCCGTGGLTLLSPRSRLCHSPWGGGISNNTLHRADCLSLVRMTWRTAPGDMPTPWLSNNGCPSTAGLRDALPAIDSAPDVLRCYGSRDDRFGRCELLHDFPKHRRELLAHDLPIDSRRQCQCVDPVRAEALRDLLR